MNNDRYFKTKTNGDWGERAAIKILETRFGKITFVDDLIDFVSESGVYIEIKTCQETIQSGNPKYPIRQGRFALTKPQHSFLVINNGFYMFMVKSGDMLMKSRIIPANQIRYSPVIQWERIFEINVSDAIPGIETTGHKDIAKSPDDRETGLKRDSVSETMGESP